MAISSNTALTVSDLDFNSIRNNLKTYLNSQSEFTDYDFEGSGLSVLLDLLTYNTYYNSFYLNMAANEAFLDTAQLRENIISHAKAINYIPTSSRAAKSLVNVVVTPTTNEDQTKAFVTLDKYTKLLGADIDGVSYPFVTVNSNTAFKSGGTFTFSNVYIQQGEVVTYQFAMTANNTLARFELPSANVDTSTLAVTVQKSNTDSYTETYLPSTDITELSANSRAYFIEENQNLKYTIQFGDGVLGYRPKDGNIVIATFVDTLGSVANNISKFSFIDPVGGLYRGNIAVNVVEKAFGGSDKESVDQIRFRAPQNYATQNRCVTATDYEALITKDFSNIDAVSIWGGEDNHPPVYGKVYISLKTKGFYALTNLEKESIKNTLISNRNVITVTPEIVDPDYIFLIVSGKVTYNPNMTTKTANQLFESVRQAVIQYTSDELNTFKSTFRKSKLQYYIENCEPSITGSDIIIYLQSRQIIDISVNKKYVISYNAPLKKGTFTEKLYTYPQITVPDSSGTLRNVFYEEVPESFTGVDFIDIINSGVNYTSATVTITGDGVGATATATVVNGRIISIDVTNKGTGYSRAVVTITGDGTEATAVARLEARLGLLRTFYYDTVGNKVIVSNAAGDVDYDTGLVNIYSVKPTAIVSNDFYDSDVLAVSVVPEGEIIPPSRNRILTLDETNAQSIQLEMVAER